MIKDEGINTSTPSRFMNIIMMKFFFSMITIFLILMSWFTIDTNIFKGLNLLAYRTDPNNLIVGPNEDYDYAWMVIVTGLSFTSAFAIIDFMLQMIGFTYNFNKCNIINLLLKIFEVFLLFYFYIDAWHYVIIWYIFIICQLPCASFEIYGLIYSFLFKRGKYDKIREKEVEAIKKAKQQ